MTASQGFDVDNRNITRSLRNAANMSVLRAQGEQARAQLATALQLDDEVILTDEPAVTWSAVPPLSELMADAKEERPEILGARAQVEAQAFKVRSIYGSLWPQLSLVGSAALHRGDATLPPFALIGGVMIDWKVFDSLSTTIAGRQAELERQRLALAEVRLQYTVSEEVRTAYASLVAAHEAAGLLTEAREVANTGVEVIRRRYRAGTALLIELLQAEDDLLMVEQALAFNAIEAAKNRGELAAAVGSTEL